MKLRFGFIGLLMMAALGVTAAWAAQDTATGDQQTAAAPKIVAPQGSFNFSSVVDGTKVEHEFVIENQGNAPLKISKVKTG